MSVDVLIPWSDTNDEHRLRALEWVTGLYTERCPTWTVILGRCPDGPWVKGRAVADALERSTADIVVIADGDVWCDATPDAAERGLRAHRWAMPHRWVKRISQHGTDAVLSGERTMRNAPHEKREYNACQGGGIVVITRELYDRCPLDPRFAGWGHEDEAWAYALRLLHGQRWTNPDGRLWHLWHPPQPRNGAYGAPASVELRNEYRAVYKRKDRAGMAELVAAAAAEYE